MTDLEAPAKAQFHAMTEGTKADWDIIATEAMFAAERLPDRVMDHLRLLDGDFGGFAVDRLTHSLQTATRAERAGRDDQYVLCALIHDIGDSLAPYSHGEYVAAVMKPYI
ncbi:MAG TPA: HD domain-containing protein, partial [Acidimicrobiales bacterium]|nr:HD domain-containing protein [Acidimicrobiales bacterium]